MNVVWKRGPLSADAVRDALPRPLKDSTVRTLLRRLEVKGYVRHAVEDRAYLYRAVEPSRSFAARAVRQIIDRFCAGSVEELVSGMVDAEVLDRRELKRLAVVVRKHRKRGR